MKAVREAAVFLVVGVMPSIGNGLRLIPIDRTTPIGTGGPPMNGNASEGASSEPLRLIAVHPGSYSPLLARTFPTAHSLAAYSLQSTRRDSDKTPQISFVYHRIASPRSHTLIR